MGLLLASCIMALDDFIYMSIQERQRNIRGILCHYGLDIWRLGRYERTLVLMCGLHTNQYKRVGVHLGCKLCCPYSRMDLVPDPKRLEPRSARMAITDQRNIRRPYRLGTIQYMSMSFHTRTYGYIDTSRYWHGVIGTKRCFEIRR